MRPWRVLHVITPSVCVGKNGQLLDWLLLEYGDRVQLERGSSSSLEKVTRKDIDDGLSQFILLAAAPRLIADRSSYSYWAGLFSVAREIHVNINYDGVHMDPVSKYRYVYHDNRKDIYFGHYSDSNDGNFSAYKHVVFSVLAPSTSSIEEEWMEQHQQGLHG